MADNTKSKNHQETLQLAKGYDYIRFTIADMHGMPRCRIVPKQHLDRIFEDGIGDCVGVIFLGVDGQIPPLQDDNLPTIADPKFKNEIRYPIPGTLTPVPWSKGKSRKLGQVLCEFKWMRSGLPVAHCTRYMAREKISRLEKLGLFLYSGFEVEFMLMDVEKRQPPFHGLKFMKSDVWNRYEDIILSVDEALQKMNVPLETLELEGGCGQFEGAIVPAFGVKSADDVFLFKQACREMVQQREDNTEVIFMTKPLKHCFANGLHFSLSLLDSNGTNALYDDNDEDKLSQLAKHWLGGLIKHAGGLTALTSPTVNCYRRLHEFVTPHQATWGIEDRNAAFRVKNNSPQNTLIECRLPSGSANPYLVVSAILAAGLDGILKKLPCPVQEDPEAEILPKTLSEALSCLEKDDVLVDAIGKEFLYMFCLQKRNFEIEELGVIDNEIEVGDREWSLYKDL